MTARGSLTRRAAAAALGASLAAAACHRDPMPDSSPPGGEPAPPSSVEVVARRPSGSPAASAVPAASPALSASSAVPAPIAPSALSSAPTPGASGSAQAEGPAASPGHQVDPQNKSKPPLESEALTASGKKLFEAIKADDPSMAKDFFFPREPFIPLKDVKGAGKYWDQLYRAYENDIHQLHKKRGKELEGAEYESFTLGSTPGWVKPGEEANKIGYFRTFNSKLHYKVDGKPRTLEVKVIISWDERWYITHLLPWKH